MRRLTTLIVFLVAMLSIAGCGGSGPQQSGQAPPQEERAQGDSEAASLSVTTMEGEQVAVGGQGDVTALYFMAGW